MEVFECLAAWAAKAVFATLSVFVAVAAQTNLVGLAVFVAVAALAALAALGELSSFLANSRIPGPQHGALGSK